MGRKEDFMFAYKIDATSKIDVDLVQHGKLGQFLQECEFVLRFKKITWTAAPSWMTVHWETKVGLLDFLVCLSSQKQTGAKTRYVHPLYTQAIASDTQPQFWASGDRGLHGKQLLLISMAQEHCHS